MEEIARLYPPLTWESTYKRAAPELQLVSHILSQVGRYFPAKRNLFTSFDKCPFPPNVVIFGQDPYHDDDQANGMAFSVDKGQPVPPSLNNWYIELEKEYSIKDTIELINFWSEEQQKYALEIEKFRETFPEQYENCKKGMYTREQLVQMATQIRPVFQRPNHGDLTNLASQKVLLLNTCLTVKPHEAGSHKAIWNGFVTKVLEDIQAANPECIFLLMGKKAEALIGKLGQRAIKICTSHPSPFSAYKGSRDAPAFIGSGCFKQINEYLIKQGKPPINWQL